MRQHEIWILAYALAAAAGACTDSTDPFATVDAGGRADTSGGDTVSDVAAGADGSPDAVDDAPSPELDMTDDTADAGVDPAADGSGGGVECGVGVVFTGQVYEDDVPNGGAPRFTPYDATYEAGIAAVIAAAPATGDPVPVELAVRGATVSATSYNNDTAQRAQSNFWLADATGAVQAYLDFEAVDGLPPFAIRVGQHISFTVTSLGTYQGMPQIRAATGWVLESEGNEVFIQELSAERPITAADALGVVRATGTLVSLDNPDCGGSSRCFSLGYGAAAPVTFRSSSSFLDVGTCLTFVGPVTLFSGTPQIDTVNFDWVWTYTAE